MRERSLCIQCSHCQAWHIHVPDWNWYPHRRYPCGSCDQATPSWIVVSEYDTPPKGVVISGRVIIGEGAKLGGPILELHAGSAAITIGDHCDIGAFSALNCSDSHLRCLGKSDAVDCKPIVLGHHTWVGSHVMIMGGAEIGHHSVVGAGSVVRPGRYPPNTLFHPAATALREGYYGTPLEER
jgi:NDP-sugar pyrophosphorylase family protein